VLSELRNPDAPLYRNRLHQPLGRFVDAVFRDLGEPGTEEQLIACYVYNRNLQIIDSDLQVVITDSIPRFAQADGVRPLSQSGGDAGELGRQVLGAARQTAGSVFLLLGGIGSGKTTYLKRFLNFVGAESLQQSAISVYLNLLAAPVTADDLERHVATTILSELRARYSALELETYENLKEAFRSDIEVLERTILSRERLGDTEYEKRLATWLDRRMHDPLVYVPKLLSLARTKGYGAVICIDNVDQLPAAYQTEIFLLAQRVAAQMSAVTIVALREESYYSASVQRTFTAYNNRSFHISSPSFSMLLSRRMYYLENLLKVPGDQRGGLLAATRDEDVSILRFFDIIRQSVFRGNHNIARFIEHLAFGNMRAALDMFATFLYSGATDVDKMLGIYERQGNYFVAFHEFAKAVILGDRRHYRESESKVLNVFDRGSEGLSSHFTLLRLINLLLAHGQTATPEGRGFVRLDEVLGAFADCFGDDRDVINAANRAVRRQLVQVDTRSTESANGSTWIRVSSGGLYYAKFLANSFAYLDLVLEDTAFDDTEIVKVLVKLVEAVDAIDDSPQTRLQKVELRFRRVEVFLDYLADRERLERASHGLDKRTDKLGDVVMEPIRAQYEREKAYIRGRLLRNAESTPEQLPLDPSIIDPEKALAALVIEPMPAGDADADDAIGSAMP